MTTSAHRLLVPSFLILAAACGQGEEEQVPVEPDPAGILRSVVDSVPEMTIGLNPEDDRYTFLGINAGGIVGDSLIVVVDDLLKRATVYGTDGRFRRRVITRGAGPGEAQSIFRAGVLPNGWTWIYDTSLQRLLCVDIHGEIVFERRIEVEDPTDYVHMDVIGLTVDGSWWIQLEDPGPDRTPGEFFRIPTEIHRIAPDGEMSMVWEGPGDMLVSGGVFYINEGRPGPETGSTRSDDLPRLLLAPYRDGVLFAWSDSATVQWLSPEGHREIIGQVPWRRIPIAYERPALDAPVAIKALRERENHVPEIHQILVDADDAVWVLRPDADDDLPATRYRLGGSGVDVALKTSPSVARLTVPTPGGLILAKRFSRETEEVYVSLHRIEPSGG